MKPLSLIGFIFFTLPLFAQDSTAPKVKWNLSGYVKDLQSLEFNKDLSHSYYTHLIHNRLNLKWKPSAKWSGSLEIRNRIFLGNDANRLNFFADPLSNTNEAFHLGKTWLRRKNMVMHSNMERLWLEYRNTKWNLRAGRQRINWGMTNTWNPNDIFNTYNFLDFDYVERPGSDAIKFQYMTSTLSNLEMATAFLKNHIIAATKYTTNFKGYDLQWIAGIYPHYVTAGFGWAGSIADVGFKGEAQYYSSHIDASGLLNITTEADYIFKNNWYISGAVLFNQTGLHKPLSDGSKISFQLSPLHLMPAKWNFLVSSSKEFTPLFNGSMSVVYSPQVQMLILFPSFKYNLQTNLDVDLVWQSFFIKLSSKFQAMAHTGFLRLKWSF